MTPKNRATMERAIGIIEGVAWTSEEKISEALFTACEILDAVLRDEEENNGN